MKKILKTNNDLLVSLASNGDPVAFYALMSHSLELNYVKMRLNGKSHSDTCKILFPDTLSLFNALKKSPEPNNFAEWVIEQNLITIPEQEAEPQKLSPEQLSAVNLFSTELQRYLVRMTSDRKKPRVSNSDSIFAKPWFKYAAVGSGAVLVMLVLYFILSLSNSAIILMLKTTNNEYHISYPFTEIAPVNASVVDSAIIDSISKVKDSTIKALEDSLAKEKERAEIKSTHAKKRTEHVARATPKPPKPVAPPPPKPIEPTPPQQDFSSFVPEPTEPETTEPVSSPAIPQSEPEPSSSDNSTPSQNSYSEIESTPYSE